MRTFIIGFSGCFLNLFCPIQVAFGFAANHGGGYQYRLCKVSARKKDITSEATETCFQSTPLAFVGDKTYIQWGWGMDVNNRTEIPAVRVSTGTTPAGSTWTRMPIPTCNDIPRGGLRKHACAGPMFPPAVPGLYGAGPGSCYYVTSSGGLVCQIILTCF